MLPALFFAAALAVARAQGPFQLDPYASNSIRVRVAPPGGAISDPELQALIGTPPSSATPVVREGANSLVNGNLRVTMDPANNFLTAVRVSDGAVLLRQTALAFAAPTVPTSKVGSVSTLASFAGTPGEKVYGLGEHRTGTVQQMPYAKRFADSQDYGKSHGGDVSIPFYSSSLGYGFVWNSAAYGFVDLSESALTWYANASLGLDVWITTTPVDFDPLAGISPYAAILSTYVDAVGHASTMPYYATGFIQCKDRYRNQSQLLDVARGYIARQLPISTVVIDWMHWTAQGDWHFNPVCWPDPQGMVDELTAMGVELMVTFWPFQCMGSRHWAEFSQDGYLVNRINATSPTSYDGGAQFLVDETNPVVRKAVFDAFWDGYGEFGIKTVWIDAAEPEHFGADSEGSWQLSAGTDGEVMEAWIQTHALAFAEGFASKGISPADYFILPRHAWAGTWRHSAALWSGDIQSSFEELAIQVTVVQGVMMSGVSLWTTDIGGYWGGDPDNAEFQDLIVRWFQFGAFCPLFRLHGHRAGGPPSNECGGTNGDNEVWNLAKEPAHYSAIVTVMRLREELREYVSQINAVAAATGMPMVRPMFLQWPLDPGCSGADVEDQFMLGPDWLVAPVTEFQATSRTVYLPALNASTHTWVYYYNQSAVGAGGARVSVPTPIAEFPLFFIRPLPPPTPLATFAATLLYSAQRSETVLCLTQQCLDANAPQQDGAYVAVDSEGLALLQPDAVTIQGVTYPTAPVTLYFSKQWSDNFVSTNSTPPDKSYTAAGGGVVFSAGWVLTQRPPGGLGLQTWFKANNATSQDFATVAEGSQGLAWVIAHGYTNVTARVPIAGFLLPSP